MTGPLLTQLTRGTPVSWGMAVVASVQATTLTVSWRGALVPEVPYLSSYDAPAAGDQVHMLLYGASGVIILGKVAPTVVPSPNPAVDPIDVDPYDVATYDSKLGLWTDGGTTQDLTHSLVFNYYSAAFAGLATENVGGVQVQLNVLPGSTLSTSIVLHNNSTLTGQLVPISVPQNVVLPDEGFQWIDLPLFWAEQLRTGAATGIALTSAANTSSGVLVSGGRLRFNLL